MLRPRSDKRGTMRIIVSRTPGYPGSPGDYQRLQGFVSRNDVCFMAKNNKNPRIGSEVKAAAPAAPAKTVTSVRNSPTPKTPAKREVTHEDIARRAYEISISGFSGSETDNWLRAERELKGI